MLVCVFHWLVGWMDGHWNSAKLVSLFSGVGGAARLALAARLGGGHQAQAHG